jgi:hypothetical protein
MQAGMRWAKRVSRCRSPVWADATTTAFTRRLRRLLRVRSKRSWSSSVSATRVTKPCRSSGWEIPLITGPKTGFSRSLTTIPTIVVVPRLRPFAIMSGM